MNSREHIETDPEPSRTRNSAAGFRRLWANWNRYSHHISADGTQIETLK